MKRNVLKLAAIALAMNACVASAAPTLHAGQSTLTFIGDDTTGYRASIADAVATCEAQSAVALSIVGSEEAAARQVANYQSIRAAGDKVIATAHVKTAAGSMILITDTWSVLADSFQLVRQVKVESANAADRAFGTGVEFAGPATLTKLTDADVFIPGMWYGTSAGTKPSALITDVGQSDFLFREDRMPLPTVSLRDRASGAILTLTHESPDGATIVADDTLDRVIDARFQFASLGLRRETDQPLRIALRFPGTEGEQTSILGFKPGKRTAERLHPMTTGATQSYTLTLRLSKTTRAIDQVAIAWRTAYARAKPQPVKFDAQAIYNASVGVLAHYAYAEQSEAFGTIAGIPFSAALPGGQVRDRSLQIGFVGQQLPCASYLIDEGIRAKRADLVTRGDQMSDFWARECINPKTGVPRTWFNVDPKPHWRNNGTFLRSATDGASGMLRAWQIHRTAGKDKAEWLTFCRAMGDWLIKTQNADGSFFREFNFADGKPKSQSRTNTLHPVRLLVDLSCATGDARYRNAAVRAAMYARRTSKDGALYVGGTPDNPDVIDKEAGWIAMDSYLALYDVTRDRRWLEAAVDAANFTETWIYAWNVPFAVDAPEGFISVPRVETVAGGASLIATGHSGSDIFLAYASLAYARLAIYTGDEHFADIARLIQANTAQFVDVDGSLKYGRSGLCIEAFSLGGGKRGSSVKAWLAWGTSAILEPMARSRELFGTIDVAEALKLPDRAQRSDAWARTRGFVGKPN